jgi:sterol desaturase/sphingolipid hydroxylase (fatty acid hydroxylase superfamily)
LQEYFVVVQSGLFEMVVQPALYALGLMTWAEPSYNAVEAFLLGTLEILLLYPILRPLEFLIPVEKWADRRGVGTDVLYTLLNRLGFVPLTVFVLLLPLVDTIDGWLRMHDIVPTNLEDLLPALSNHPLLSFFCYVVILDFSEYIRHRMEHKFDWWWALHSLHHAQQRMTFWTDNRNHLIDDLLGGLWTSLVALLIGVPPSQFVLIVLLTRAVESLSHANARVAFGAVGERLMVSPRYHRMHHAIGAGEEGPSRGCNFSILLPVWDILFGTANFERSFPATGTRDQQEGKNYGEGFWAQQRLGANRLLAVLFSRHQGNSSS